MNEPETYQGMSLAVVANLLALAQTYHQGFVPGEAQIRAFHDVAVRYRWTADETEKAIRKWGADRGRDDWLDPALLNRMIRDARQDRMSREAAPRQIRPGAHDGDFAPVGDDPDWGRNNSPELERIHAHANTVSCEYCGQSTGQRCKNKVTGNATKIPHLFRLKTTGVNGSTP